MSNGRRWVFTAVVWILLFPVLLGARCNPDPPACGADAGTAPITCPPGEAPACLNRCMPLRGPGQPCDRDPCLLQNGVCANGLSCFTLLSNQQPTCQPPNPEIQPSSTGLLFCDSFLQACAGEDYCRPFSDGLQVSCANSIKRPRIAPALADGSCVAPQREGQMCDSSWNELFTDPFITHCAVCEPGMTCVPDPRPDHAGQEVCLRDCSTGVAACPCNVSGDPERFDTCEDGVCSACAAVGETCSSAGWGCCAAGAVCGGAGNTCCLISGQSCTSDAVCCPLAGRAGACEGGTCHTCGPDGALPDPLLRCCSGFEPLPGHTTCPVTCRTPSTGGRPGMLEPAGGPCTVAAGSSAGCAGVWACTGPGGAAVCTPTPLPGVADDCDGVNDDCDASLDEDFVAGPCSGPVPPSGTFGGCPLIMAPGTWRCDHLPTGATCGSQTGYCALDSLGNQVSHPGPNQTCFTTGEPCVVGLYALNSQCGFSEACCDGIHRGTTCETRSDIAPGTCWPPDAASPTPDGTCPGYNPCAGPEASTCAGCDILGVPPTGGGGGCGWCETTMTCEQGNPSLTGPAVGGCADWRSSEITGCALEPP